MKVLVTGATGFIGSELVKLLIEKGYEVNCLFRDRAKTLWMKHERISLFKGDILDYESLRKAVTGCDGVFHTAAFTAIWAKDEDEIFRLNVTGTINILEAALAENVRDIVITSTAGVIGPSIKGIITEKTERETAFFIKYEQTKAIAEVRALEYLSKGLNIRIVNPTRVYGPGPLNSSNSVTKLIKQYNSGQWHIIPGNGKSIGNYVFVGDVVAGHILAMQKGRTGERYILGGENISFDDLFRTISELCGKKNFMIHLPLPLMIAASKASMFVTRITGLPPFITPGLVRKYNYTWTTSSEKAEKELGYKITPLKDGITKTLQWLNNGFLPD
jgi:nucleoside-diphosphate-sugar epimerase